MIAFLSQSQTFDGLTFKGCYQMPFPHFVQLYNYWKNTDRNLLDTYSEFVYNLWDSKSAVMEEITPEKHYQLVKSFGLLINILEIPSEQVEKVYATIDAKLANYEKRAEAKDRYVASLHTSKPSVRKQVFAKYGNVCLCCGSTEQIQIDHIVPVAMGGENHISNYQPLCRSCNSKKGATIADYRKTK